MLALDRVKENCRGFGRGLCRKLRPALRFSTVRYVQGNPDDVDDRSSVVQEMEPKRTESCAYTSDVPSRTYVHAPIQPPCNPKNTQRNAAHYGVLVPRADNGHASCPRDQILDHDGVDQPNKVKYNNGIAVPKTRSLFGWRLGVGDLRSRDLNFGFHILLPEQREPSIASIHPKACGPAQTHAIHGLYEVEGRRRSRVYHISLRCAGRGEP